MEKKVASLNKKKTLLIKESGEKMKTNYLKEMITLFCYSNKNRILK